jgi:hypothetical protein
VTTAITPYLAPGGVISIATAQRIDYFGRARGRAGITFGWFGGGYGGYGGCGGPGGFSLGGPILLYVPGGFAYAGVREGFVSTDNSASLPPPSATTAALATRLAAASNGCSYRTGRSRANTQYIDLRHGPRAAANEFVGGVGTAFVINHVNPRIHAHVLGSASTITSSRLRRLRSLPATEIS